jgi:hypothetical protein
MRGGRVPDCRLSRESGDIGVQVEQYLIGRQLRRSRHIETFVL